MKKIIKLIVLKGLNYVLIGLDVLPFYFSKLINKIGDKIKEAIRKIKRDLNE